MYKVEDDAKVTIKKVPLHETGLFFNLTPSTIIRYILLDKLSFVCMVVVWHRFNGPRIFNYFDENTHLFWFVLFRVVGFFDFFLKKPKTKFFC